LTQNVKTAQRRTGPDRLARPGTIHYNRVVPAPRFVKRNRRLSGPSASIVAFAALLVWPLLAGASCKKEGKDPNAATNPADVVKAADNAKLGPGPGAGHPAPAGKVDTTPLAGIDLGKLSDDKKTTFFKLVDSLESPCNKPHSLRTSFNQDKECKRAPFAVRYVVALLEDEATEDQVRQEYDVHYKSTKTYSFKLDGVPHMGNPEARIKLVEFFDYGCPACKEFKPMLDQVIAEHGSQIVVYYKMFPLIHHHPNSMSAAQAVLAAQAQGKFKEMHDLLFDKAPAHTKDDVVGYAKDLGLDVDKFKADYDAAEPRVKADMEEGDASDVDSTPTLFFQGHMYKGPMHPRYIGMWIDEDVAVNR
jgi:protein-disulfide isomerase